MVLSAYPLSGIVVDHFSATDATVPASRAEAPQRGDVDLPFGENPPSTTPGTSLPGTDDASSRPASSFNFAATGSALLDQVLGASALLGHQVALPDLPLQKLAPENPLRHAILGWILVTNSDVPADELAVELARADALPEDLQRNLAILVLSASEATLLQNQALAKLSPEDLAWVQANPDLADALVNGANTPDTNRLASLAALVDIEKSVQASLLLLQAVEVTRAPLAKYSASELAIPAIGGVELDGTTRSILDRLAGPVGASDAEKIRFAADLVAVTSGIPLERQALPDVTFTEGIQFLLAATSQPVDVRELDRVIRTANALPDDLSRALGSVLYAQARAVAAANPSVLTSEGQARALVDLLDATAAAIPTLEKYALFWNAAPESMRVGQWDTAGRIQWAAQSGGLLASAQSDPAEIARGAGALIGGSVLTPAFPKLTFAQAVEAGFVKHGVPFTADARADTQRASDHLATAVRDAAALMLSGSLEADRLNAKAFSALTPEERDFLLTATDVDALYFKTDLTADELARLTRFVTLTQRVDVDSIIAAGIIGVESTLGARDILLGAGAYTAQGTAEPRQTGWRALLANLMPFGMARAQTTPIGCVDMSSFFGSLMGSDCANDVVFFFDVGGPSGELLRITGERGTIQMPRTYQTIEPCAPKEQPSRFDPITGAGICERSRFRLSSPAVHIDLGGDDVYQGPVALTPPTLDPQDPRNILPRPDRDSTALFLDIGGRDTYLDPTPLYDSDPLYAKYYGANRPMPTQASAYGGGTAVLVDAAGNDQYDAESRSQGYGRFGFAALIDLQGGDTYKGKTFVQGAASEGVTPSIGLLIDARGNDRYQVEAGMGYGYGGILLDLEGKDTYTGIETVKGVPMLHLDVIPGGDIVTLNKRGDDRMWLDGPAGINMGISIDREVNQQSAADSDGDGDRDLVEFLSGSDPNDPYDNAAAGRARRQAAIVADSDLDGYPDSVERAFSTNPNDPRSYPAGFPSAAAIPQSGDRAVPAGGDKIFDLRLPIQNAGSIEKDCVYRSFNSSAAYTLVDSMRSSTTTSTCIFLAYDSNGQGAGNLTIPTSASTGTAYEYDFPLGIFALGDTVNTNYAIDYFVAIDMGGSDTWRNRAGGALPVIFQPKATGGLNTPVGALAPSLAVSIDNAGSINDVYTAPVGVKGNQVQGALLGVLIDTAGDDRYTAGNSSQGAEGGVLLDLAGKDIYKAGNLSQGASVNALTANENTGRGLPNDGRPASTDAVIRRAAPGLLADYGTGNDTYTAMSHSQGSARGFELDTGAGQTTTPYATGILYDEGGFDRYTVGSAAINAQGVGSARALGILYDRAGNDTYTAWGIISQGATTSQTFYEAKPGNNRTGAGIVFDSAGSDIYTYIDASGVHDRTSLRRDNVTLSRGNAAEGNVQIFADIGLHIDGEGSNLAQMLAGTGGGNVTNDNPGNFTVHMPSARFAIGSTGYTTYEREYAFVVDLGGENTYNYTAAGFIRDVVAQTRQNAINGQAAVGTVNGERIQVSAYPVSFLFDAGSEASHYNSRTSLSQGAGFFSVGVLIDAGGHDAFDVIDTPLPSIGSGWMARPPIVDGTIAASEWATARTVPLTLTGLNDTRFVQNAVLRIGNDHDNLYIALEIPTRTSGVERQNDWLTIDFDTNRDRSPIGPNGFTGLDEIMARPTTPCSSSDRHYNAVSRSIVSDVRIDPVADQPNGNDIVIACALPSTGGILYEITKPIRITFPTDPADLAARYDEVLGLIDRDLGLRIATTEKATGESYAWPARTTNVDGGGGFTLNGDLADELAAWGALRLANQGITAEPVNATRTSSIAQGASVGGVGILAMLGNAQSNAQLNASERAQGYGGFGGIGLLLDAGGSDTYRATRMAQGAADAFGVGILYELEGNDNYLAVSQSTGFGIGQGASGLFYDLAGSDEYRNLGVLAQNIRTEGFLDTKADGDFPPGNQRVWTQGPSSIGLDTASNDAFRNIVNTARGQTFGVPRTTLSITKYSTSSESCTTIPVPPTTDGPARDIVTGMVCLNARVELAWNAPGAPLTSVDSIDFLVDGLHVPGIPTALIGKYNATFILPLDASTLEDGVSTVTAIASIRAATTPSATIYKDSAGAAQRTVYVNNAPRISLGLTPAFTGGVDAAFSPNSALAERTLGLNWAVSHDAKEDRLELYQGWTAPVENLNAPCSASTTKLCNVLPFYLTADGGRMRTNPGSLAVPQQSSMGDGQNPFSSKTDVLLTHVDLDPADTFKVFLSNRVWLAPGSQATTNIRIELLTPDEKTVTVDGKDVLIANMSFGPITPPAVTTTAASFAVARGPDAPDTGSFAKQLCDAIGGCVPTTASVGGEGGTHAQTDSWQNFVLPAILQEVPGHLEIVDGRLRVLENHVLKLVIGLPGTVDNTASNAYKNNVVKPYGDATGEVGESTIGFVDKSGDIRTQEAGLAGRQTKSVFLYGSASAPSRLEVRVPAEPATRANMSFERIGTDETVEFVQPVIVEGDVIGTPTANGRRHTERAATFNGILGTETIPDGTYRVRLYATDASGLSVNTTSTFLLDATAPTSRITTPSEIGRPLLASTGAIPVRWTVDEASASSSGLDRTYLYHRAGVSGPWTRIANEFPANARGFDYSPAGGTVFSFLTIAVDRAGNVEGMDASAGDLAATLAAAVAKKEIIPGGFQTVTIDKDAPILSGIPQATGGRVLNYKGNELMFVRAGAPVRFSVEAADQGASGTGIGNVNITFVYVESSTGKVTSRSSNLCTYPTCQSPYVYDGWGTVNTNSTLYPDGVWAVIFDITDRAANRIQVSAGNVLLDSKAPTVSDLEVVYPPGQAAAKPGDRLSVRAHIYDEFGLDEKISHLNLTGTAVVDGSIVNLRPIRVNGEIVFEGSFTLAATADRARGDVTNRLVVSDFAGNALSTPFTFKVDNIPSSIVPNTLRVTDITHNSFTVRWNTTEPTSDYVKFGTGPFELRGKTPVNSEYGYEHAVVVEDLASSTRYFLRAVSATPAGVVEETDTLDALTTTALFLRAVSPAAGDAVSGVVPVRFEGGLLDSVDFVTYTLEARSRATANYSFVTTTTTRGTEHTLEFNSSRYLDGDAYEFRLSAEAGKERRNVMFGPFTSDNTIPRLTVITPLVATNKSTPSILVEARDLLAGFPANAFTLTIDGTPVTSLDVQPAAEGFNVKHVVTEALAPGEHTFSLTGVDKAGNVAVETWTVAIDSDAPELAANATKYDPGLAAARAGGLATFNMTITDASAISLVEADTSAVSSQASTRLFRVTGTNHWVGTVLVSSVQPQATFDITVKATDVAGNSRTGLTTLVVDNVAPAAGDVVVRSTTHTSATLGVTANEPVILRLIARAGSGPQQLAETSELSLSPTVKLSGLLPSRVYAYTLTIEDGAGNAAVDKTGSFTTSQDLIKPTEVKGLVVTDLLNGTLRLTWQPAEDDIGVAQYRVYRSDDGISFQPIAEISDTMFEDTGLPLERGYVYQIVAVDYGGNEGNVIETVRASATTVPTLSIGAAAPTVGSASTTFKYTVRYQSAGGVPPAYVRVLIDGAPQEMKLVGQPDYVNGAVYEFDTRLAPHKRDAPHTYAFEVNDGRYTVRFPADGTNIRGPLVSGDLRADAGSIGVANFAQNVPLGGAAGALGAILVAALAAAVIVRKKKEGSK